MMLKVFGFVCVDYLIAHSLVSRSARLLFPCSFIRSSFARNVAQRARVLFQVTCSMVIML